MPKGTIWKNIVSKFLGDQSTKTNSKKKDKGLRNRSLTFENLETRELLAISYTPQEPVLSDWSIRLPENSGKTLIDLRDHIKSDKGDLKFTVTSNTTNSTAIITMYDNCVMVIDCLPNKSLTVPLSIDVKVESVIVGLETTATKQLKLYVNAQNHVPYVENNTAPIIFNENSTSAPIDLNGIFGDADNGTTLTFSGHVLSYSYGACPVVAEIDSNGILIFHGLENAFGWAEYAIFARDQHGKVASTTFWVVVNRVEHAPELRMPIPNSSFTYPIAGINPYASWNYEQDLRVFFWDIDQEAHLIYTVEDVIGDRTIFSVQPKIENNFLRFTYNTTLGKRKSSATIIIKAVDPSHASNSQVKDYVISSFTATLEITADPSSGCSCCSCCGGSSCCTQHEDITEVWIGPYEKPSNYSLTLALNNDYDKGQVKVGTESKALNSLVNGTAVLERVPDNYNDYGYDNSFEVGRNNSAYYYVPWEFAGYSEAELRMTSINVWTRTKFTQGSSSYYIDRAIPGTIDITIPPGVVLWIPEGIAYGAMQDDVYYPGSYDTDPRFVPFTGSVSLGASSQRFYYYQYPDFAGMMSFPVILEGVNIDSGSLIVTYTAINSSSTCNGPPNWCGVSFKTASVPVNVMQIKASVPAKIPNDPDDPRINVPSSSILKENVMYVNSRDDDCDGIPNIYDGYNADSYLNKPDKPGDDLTVNASKFLPIDIKIPDGIDMNVARIYFAYQESDPLKISIDSNGRHYGAPPGIRLWTEDQMYARNPRPASIETTINPGNYIKASLGSYSPNHDFPLEEDQGSYTGCGCNGMASCSCGGGVNLSYPYSNTKPTNSYWPFPVDTGNGAIFEAVDRDVYYPNLGTDTTKSNGVHSYYISQFNPVNRTIRLYVEGVSAGEYSIVFYVDPDGNEGPTASILKDQIKVTFVSDVTIHATDAYGSETKNGAKDNMVLSFSRGVGDLSGDLPVYFRIVHKPNTSTMTDPSFPGKLDVKCMWPSSCDGGSLVYDPVTGIGSVTIRNGSYSVNLLIDVQNDVDVEWDEVLNIELMSWDEYRNFHAFPRIYTSTNPVSDTYNPFLPGLTGQTQSIVSPNNGIPGKKGYYLPNGNAYKTTLTLFDDDYAFIQTNRNTDIQSTGEIPLLVSNGEIAVNLYDGSVVVALDMGRHIPTYRNNTNIRPVAEIETRFPLELDWNTLTALNVSMNVAGVQGQEYSFQSSILNDLKNYLAGNPGRTFKILVYGPENLENILPTGSYDMDVKLKATFGVLERTRTFRGIVDIVNRISTTFNGSEFGNNWTLDELDRLVLTDRVTPLGPINTINRTPKNVDSEDYGNIVKEDDLNAASLYSQRGGTSSTALTLVRGDNSTARFEMKPDFSSAIKAGMTTSGNTTVTYSGSSPSGSFSDHWGFLGPNDYYGAYNERYTVAQSNNPLNNPSERWVEWKFDNLTPGCFYQIYISWTPGADHAKNVQYQIKTADAVGTDSSGHQKTVYVDQRFKPGELYINGTYWRSIGFYVPSGSGTQITVRMSSQGANGVISANGIMLVKNWEITTPDGSATLMQYNSDESGSGCGSGCSCSGGCGCGCSGGCGCGCGGVSIAVPTGHFQYTYKSGERKDFDAHGLQKAIIDGNNNQIQYAYGTGTSFGRLNTITEQGGLTWTFSYGAKYLSSVTDFANRVTTFSGTANQSSVTLPAAQFPSVDIQYTFAYGNNNPNRLTQVTYGGESTTISYNSKGLADTVTNPDTTSWALDSAYEVAQTIIYRPGYGHIGSKSITASSTNSVAYLPELTAKYTDAKSSQWQYQMDAYCYVLAEAKPMIGSEENVWLWDRNKHGLVTKYIAPAGGVSGTVSSLGIVSPTTLGELVTTYTYRGESNPPNPRSRFNLEKIEYPIKYNNQFICEQFTYNSNNLLTTHSGTAVAVSVTYEYYGDTPNVQYVKENGTARKTYYTYTDAPTTINGLPGGLVKDEYFAYQEVEQKKTTFVYYTSGQNIGLPQYIHEAEDIVGLKRTTTFTYDKRNVSTVQDALGRITTYVYDNLNRLIEQRLPDPDGSGPLVVPIVTYVYNNRGLLQSETDQTGKKRQYTYDGMGRVTQESFVGSSGGTISTSYQYDANGNLTKATDALNHSILYAYDARDRLIKTTCPAISSTDSLFSQLAPSSILITPQILYTYDVHDNLLTVTDPRENTVTSKYYYDELGRQIIVSEKVTLSTGSHFDNPTQYVYNAKGQLESQKSLVGANGSYSYVTTSYAYDTLGRLQKITLPAASGSGTGTTTTRTYDKRDNLLTEVVSGTGGSMTTSYYYDKLDRLIAVQHPNGLGTLYGYNLADELMDELSGQFTVSTYLSGSNTTTTSYSIPTNLATVTSPKNYKSLIETNYNDSNQNTRYTKYQYDSVGRLVMTTLPDQDGTGAATPTTISLQYDNAGNVIQQTTAAWQAASIAVAMEYDQFNRLIKTFGTNLPTTETTYDNNSNVLSVTVKDGATVMSKEAYSYDSLGRRWKTIYGGTDLANGNPVVYAFYDAAGNLVKSSSAFTDDTNTVVGYKSTLHDYGFGNRLLKTQTPLSEGYDVGTTLHTNTHIVTSYTYYVNGQLYLQAYPVDNAVKVTQNITDNLGQVTAVKEYSNGLSGPAPITTSFTYDGLGRRTSITDPEGNVTSYSYKVGQELGSGQSGSTVTESITSPATTRISSFNVFGELKSYKDRNNQTTTYTYDRAGNLLVESCGLYVATFTYNGLGQQSTAADSFNSVVNSSYQYLYNTANLPDYVLMEGFVPNKTIQYKYVYDVLGNVKSRMVTDVGVTDMFTTFYDHDSLNRIKTITERTSTGASSTLWAKNKRIVINHDKLINNKRTTEIHRWEPLNLSSPLDSEKIGKSEYIRHNDGKLSQINHYAGTSTSTIDYQAFTYDNFGRVRTIADPINPTPMPYSYDTFGQITNVSGKKITYDASGNPSGNTGAYNRLNNDPLNAYTYDNEGNIVTHRAYEPLVAGVAGNSSASDYISLGTTALTRDWYRLTLDHIKSNYSSFTVKLYKNTGVFDELIKSFSVSLSGDNDVICLDFFLPTGVTSGEFYVHFTNSVIDPTISAGSVLLNKLDTYREYKWDHKNRLIQTDQFTAPVSGTNPAYNTNKISTTKYRYDVYGNRIEKEIFTYSGTTALPYARNIYVPENGHTLMEYEYRNNNGYKPVRMTHSLYAQAVDQLFATDSLDLDTSGGPTALKTIWSLTDYQNTVKMLLSKGISSFTSERLEYDVFGKPSDMQNFDPFGQPQAQVGSLSQLVSARYAGREFDYDTGLQYNRARYYNPTSGRWMSEDPIGFAGGDYNLYRYCGNSHTNGTDPSGNIVVASCVALGLGILGRQLLYGAANQYDAATKVNEQPGYTQKMADQYNYHAGWGNFYEGSGRLAGTAAFVVAGAPLFQPLYGAGAMGTKMCGLGTIGQWAAGAATAGISSKLILDSSLLLSGTDPDAFRRYYTNPGWTTTEFALNTATAGLFNGGNQLLYGLSQFKRGTIANQIYRSVLPLIAKNPFPSGIVHLTHPDTAEAFFRGKATILGSRWGVFGLKSGQVPKSNILRNIKTLVPGNLAGEISIPAGVLKHFNSPPIFGPFSLVRRLMGVKSTPLGSIDMVNGVFMRNLIRINDEFVMATARDISRYQWHQWTLNYGVDSLIYGTGGAGIAWWGFSTGHLDWMFKN